MLQTHELSTAALYVDNLLTDAQQALTTNNLNKAKELYKQALEVPGSHPERETKIRDAVKQYSEQIAKQDEPDWQLAHESLGLLDYFALDNDETRAWQCHLSLEQADFLLGQEDINESFQIFDALMQHEQANPDKLKAEISKKVRVNMSQHADNSKWPLLRQIIERVRELRLGESELQEWLETISKVLTAVETTDQAKKEREKQLMDTLTWEKQRFQKITYALGAILALVLLVYTLILLYLWFNL